MAEKVPLTDPAEQALFAPIQGQYDRTNMSHPSGMGQVPSVQGAVSSKHRYGDIGTGEARSEWGSIPGDTHPSRSIGVSLVAGHTNGRFTQLFHFGRHKMGAARETAAEISENLGESRGEAFRRSALTVADAFLGNGPEGDDFVVGGHIVEAGRDERLTRGSFTRSAFAYGWRMGRDARGRTPTNARERLAKAGRLIGAAGVMAVSAAGIVPDAVRIARRGAANIAQGGSFFRSGH